MQIQGKYSNCGDTPTIPTRLQTASHMTFFTLPSPIEAKRLEFFHRTPCTQGSLWYEQVDAGVIFLPEVALLWDFGRPNMCSYKVRIVFFEVEELSSLFSTSCIKQTAFSQFPG